MAADSVLTFACVIYGTLKYGDVVDLRDGNYKISAYH